MEQRTASAGLRLSSLSHLRVWPAPTCFDSCFLSRFLGGSRRVDGVKLGNTSANAFTCAPKSDTTSCLSGANKLCNQLNFLFVVVRLWVESSHLAPARWCFKKKNFTHRCSWATPVDLLHHTTTIHKEVSQRGSSHGYCKSTAVMDEFECQETHPWISSTSCSARVG